jgi:hypothetical protein
MENNPYRPPQDPTPPAKEPPRQPPAPESGSRVQLAVIVVGLFIFVPVLLLMVVLSAAFIISFLQQGP